MNYKLGLLSFFVIIAIAVGSFLYLFKLQDGKQVVGEWWLVNSYQLKGLAADNIKSKKIMIVSGSNSLFSINSEILTNKTGLPVVNLATHAGLDLNYHFFIIKKYMRKGDVVVMPLEYEYYSATGKPTDWFVNNMTGWGHDYISSLSILEQIRFLMNVTPKRLFDGLIAKDNGYVDPLDKVLETYTLSDGSYNGYSYKSMSKAGDINYMTNGKTVFENIENGAFNYSSNIEKPSDYFFSVIMDIKKYVEARGGKFVLTWPVTMRNSSFDTDSMSTMESLNHLKKVLKFDGIEMRCSPSASNLGKKFFMDSPYHTNGFGAKIRSEFLGDCLNTVLFEKGGYNDEQNFRAVILELESKTPFHD